jgi:hypothetical protein
MARTKKLERINPPEGSVFASLSREQLLLHPDEVGAAAELRRRAFNKMVKKQESVAA